MALSQNWSIIVFGYNEAGTLRQFIEEVQTVLRILSPKESEIVIVDDGSTDGTIAICQDLVKKYSNLRVVRHAVNRGIGPTLLTGYANVQFENCCALPADGQFNPAELLPFSVLAENTVISFWRSKREGYSSYRALLTRFHRGFNRILLGLDLQDVNWVKIYKAAGLRKLHLQLTSSLVETEICAKFVLSGYRVTEVDSQYRPRHAGQSRGASLATVLTAAREMGKIVSAVTSFRLALGRRSPSSQSSAPSNDSSLRERITK